MTEFYSVARNIIYLCMPYMYAISYLLTILIAAVLIISRLYSRLSSKRCLFFRLEWMKALYVLVPVTLFFMFCSLYPGKGFISSIYVTMRSFFMGADWFTDFEPFKPLCEALDLGINTVYRASGILCIAAPALTLSAVAALFSDTLSLVRYRLSVIRKTYVFSELNSKSVELAKSIFYERKKGIIDFIFPPAILFTSVEKDTTGTAKKLVDRAKGMGMLLTKHHIVEINLHRGSVLYFIDEDEENNVTEALEIAKRRIKCEIYVFSCNESTIALVDTYNNQNKDAKNAPSIKLISESKIIAYDLLYNYPLYLAEDENKKTKLLILGAGRIGMQIAKLAASLGQSLDGELEIVLADRRQDIRELFEKGCYDEGITLTDILRNDYKTKVTYISEVNVNGHTIPVNASDSSVEAIFTQHSDAGYIVIALGEDNDEQIIQTAFCARKIAERTEIANRLKGKKSINPIIVPIIRNDSSNATMRNTSNEGACTSGFCYHLIPFGSNSHVFKRSIIHEHSLWRMASEINYLYSLISKYKPVYMECTQRRANIDDTINMTAAAIMDRTCIIESLRNEASQQKTSLEKKEKKLRKDIMRELRYKPQIEQDSNLCAALHTIYKLNSLGFSYTGDKLEENLSAPETRKNIIEAMYRNHAELTRLEHRRWNVFYLIYGFKYFSKRRTDEEKNAYFPKRKDYVAGLHIDLLPFEILFEQNYDFMYDCIIADATLDVVGVAFRNSIAENPCEIGLKRGTVRLSDFDPRRKGLANKAIIKLQKIFGESASIHHVGSTSICGIKAKPIIDIAVGVKSLKEAEKLIPQMEKAGFLYRESDLEGQILFACGDYSKPDGIQTHFIHVVEEDSEAFRDYINFRDYLNARPSVAAEYERLKIELAEMNAVDKDRENYLKGKAPFIKHTLRKALVWSYLGKNIDIKIDRPIGYVHKKEKYSLTYPINYGYIEGVSGGDGEELDVYLLGVDMPVKSFTAHVIGIAHRRNDVEDKLIAAPEGTSFTAREIKLAVEFQEQYYDSYIETVSGEIL